MIDFTTSFSFHLKLPCRYFQYYNVKRTITLNSSVLSQKFDQNVQKQQTVISLLCLCSLLSQIVYQNLPFLLNRSNSMTHCDSENKFKWILYLSSFDNSKSGHILLCSILGLLFVHILFFFPGTFCSLSFHCYVFCNISSKLSSLLETFD